MDFFENKNLKLKIRKIPDDVLVQFLKKNLSNEKLQSLMNLDVNINYSGINLDDFLLNELLLGDASSIEPLLKLGAKDNEYLPKDKLYCRIPKSLKNIENLLYLVLLPNGKVETRLRLPKSVQCCFYKKEIMHFKENSLPKFRQQIVLDIVNIDNKNYLFLRGYGIKKFNRYAISVYCSDDNTLWKTPSYKEILTIYKEILADNDIPIFQSRIQSIISGTHPTTIEKIAERDMYYDDKNIPVHYKIFSYFIYYLNLSEEFGMFTSRYMKIGLKAIKEKKSIADAIKAQENFGKRAFVRVQDFKINKITRELKYLYHEMDDVDATMDEITNEFLTPLEHSDLSALYARLCYVNNIEKQKNIEYWDLISEIKSILYSVLDE